ncbi:efflux RND transporter periplasmic adaptor subunit [Vibrio sp. JC009]|uniref:efflux RND transporter periplasmic adaptor subunit n=1 Tax=Vibrio sp. JC009 TaxID=2912314 RepID=UPI0023AEC37D|nr:efflux RND transporter periplasmic adaptor subunit [Vibrio sp. JC009]WED22278.1 efflux RND transporter periplasmic adaptor subunit [Vibrio sp. JC009]
MRRISPLTFLSHRPWLISLLIIIGLSLWLSMGMLKAEESSSTVKSEHEQAPLARVVYQTFTPQNTAKKIDLYGRTAPDRQAKLGAEVAGKVTGLLVKKGDFVEKGQGVVQVDKANLETQLERAKASLRLREKEYKAAQSLKSKGLQGEVAFTQAQSSLIEARALVKDAQLAIKNSLIKAPFDGIVDDLFVDLGDFIGVGDPVSSFIDLKKLVIEADVSERHIQSLELNQKARIRMIGGQIVYGKLRYISRVSSVATNTFPIEVEIENRDGKIPAGISAEVELELEATRAIKVTPAMLALDESGNLGVKTVKDNMIKFVPIQLVKAEQDGVWLSGFGDSVDIVTVGQGFVRDGDRVIAVSKNPDNSQ